MKLYCSREELLMYINVVNKAVSSRTTLPILQCILLNADDKGFYLTATDLELGIQSAPITANIEERGSVALEARMLSEIIRKVVGDEVLISSDEKNVTTIVCGSSKFQIMGQNGAEFPELPKVEKNQEYRMLQKDLKNCIRQTIFSIAQNEAKPILTGELLEIVEDHLHLVSVDGYRISFRKVPMKISAGNFNEVIPGKTMTEIYKILSQEGEDEVSIYFTDKHALFDIGGSIVVSRLLEGEYIKYSQSFTEDYKTKIQIQTSLLVQALERASLVAREAKKTPVLLHIKEKELILTSNAEMGMAYESVAAEMEGDTLEIAFNPKYLIDALRAIEDEMVTIQFTTPLSPCIIRPVTGDAFQYLILPLRM